MFKLLAFYVLALAVSGCTAVVINVDTSKAPELQQFGSRVKSTLEEWFPYMGTLLESPTYVPPQQIPIYFDPEYDGVAYASGGQIVGAVNYYLTHQEDVGSMIHEMVHIIQNYNNCAGWVTEGIADWARYYHYEPNNKPQKPRPDQHYTNGYGVSAYFLNYINERYTSYPMMYYINKDCREGTYNDSIFPRLTDKTVDQLWDEMMATEKSPVRHYKH